MTQPQITPGSNGYMDYLQQTDWKNPWSGIAQDDQQAAQAGVQQGMGNISGMQQSLGSYQQQSSPYPTFPNAAGVGSQNAFMAAPSPAQTPASQAQAPSYGGDSSRGFNPWSLQGEANAR